MKDYIRDMIEEIFDFQNSLEQYIITIGCIDLLVALIAKAGMMIDLQNFCFTILALLIVTCCTFVFMDTVAFIILGLFWIQEKMVEIYKRIKKGSDEV